MLPRAKPIKAGRRSRVGAIDNLAISHWLAEAAQDAPRPLQMALKRASRQAFLWPEEASDIVASGRSLQELPGIGPHIERMILSWLESPPESGPIPPLRQDFLTIAKARKLVPKKWLAELRGDLQMHTLWSDGSGTVLDMAAQAEKRHYHFIAITDHSQGLKIAGGMTPEEFLEQGSDIDAVNRRLQCNGSNLRVLKSIEMNLNPRGEGDMDSDCLSRLDVVLGSFHSALRIQEDQTERYLAALRNPEVNILGHPRGRVFNYRIGLSADWPRVFAEAARLNKAVEIDAYYDRQDLDWKLLKVANCEGCQISIGTDSHSPDQLGFIELGLAAAALAKIPTERILNFWPREKLIAWAGKRGS